MFKGNDGCEPDFIICDSKKKDFRAVFYDKYMKRTTRNFTSKAELEKIFGEKINE